MRTASHSPSAGAARQATPRAPLPPGPPRILGLRGALRFLADPLPSVENLRDTYGDTAGMRFGPYRFIFVHNPEDVHHVLVDNHRNYVKSRSYEGLRLVMGNGLVTSEGDFWRRQRRLSQPAFHRRRLEGLSKAMADRVAVTASQWTERSDGKPLEVDFHEEMMQMTLGIVGQTLFGLDLSHESSTLGPAVSCVLEHANDFAESFVRIPLWVPTPANTRFGQQKKLLDNAVHKIISERRAHDDDQGDLLSMLMAVTGESDDDRMSDAQLRDEVMTLFLAGHETIATAMSWTFMLLSQHPDVLTRVREELHNVLGDAPVRFEDLPKLSYTGSVIDEAMRLYPPVWIIERQALEEDTVGGFRVPKGAAVVMSPWGLHHSPKLWKDPKRFDPDRFSAENRATHPKYAYLPFGGGPRFCIGNNFALMEAKIILATFVRQFDISILNTPVPIPRVTLRPVDGMPAHITPRQPHP